MEVDNRSVATNDSQSVLVAVWVVKESRGDFFVGVPEQPSVYDLGCMSSDRSVHFSFQTGNLAGLSKRKCALLKQHGFTVIRVEKLLTLFANSDGHSQLILINTALNHVVELYGEDEPVMADYDEDFGRAVLAFVASKHPARVQMMDIKEALKPEPTDAALLLALDALSIDGYIEGKGMRESTSGANRLAIMANIVSTRAGREHLKPAVRVTESGGISNLHFHAPVGAVGHNSQGYVNVNQQWISGAPEPDWAGIAAAFDEAAKAKASSASSSEDYVAVAGLVKAHEEAVKKDKPGFLETVQKIGQSSLPILASAGAHGLVSYLQHEFGWKLS